MVTRLDVYRQAELHIGKSQITSLSDDVEGRYKFDQAWLGVVEEAFNEGDWNFAKMTSSLVSNGDEPTPGWAYAFDYPDNYLRTVSVLPFINFTGRFDAFSDVGGKLYGRADSLVLTYIRNDLVNAVETWPTMFWRFVALKLAYETCEALTNGSTKQEDLEKRMKKALMKARSVDAMNENNKRLQPGSWMRARGGFGRAGGNVYTVAGSELVTEEGDV